MIRGVKMFDFYTQERDLSTIPVLALTSESYKAWLDQQDEFIKNWLNTHSFEAKAATVAMLPNSNGRLEQVILGVENELDFWSWGALARLLPEGAYHIANTEFDEKHLWDVRLGWGLGHYQFDEYVEKKAYLSRLLIPADLEIDELNHLVQSIFTVRDLINMPANELSPEQLACIAKEIATQHGGQFSVTVGDELLKKNYPTIHAVGKACDVAPRLIDFSWGDPSHKKITLVGKGVCFDSGGLDLKSAKGMLTMKKDMGGSAHVLGLANSIMAQGLPVRLRVLIPAVENSVSGKSYRPGDVIKTRHGLTVEVGNTDAEGRLVLCDALSEASNDKPDMIIDFATLTGAARIALGTDLPAFFTNDDTVSEGLCKAAMDVQDPVWRLPLHQPYKKLLQSKVADLNNVASSPYGGAITAALYLQHFVAEGIPWIHFDIMASNERELPGRPEGGEAMGLRAMYQYIKSLL